MSEAQKERAAKAALEHVEADMIIGLGTGSTAAYFIEALGARARDGLRVACVPTSEETRAKALAAGLDVIEPDETTTIDLAVDGADEVDGELNLIKGGGAALLREKIVAAAARKFIVIADASKRVSALGAFALPLEVEPALWALTVREVRGSLSRAGYENAEIALRGEKPGPGFARSDGGHFILDCALGRITDAATLDRALRALPGVIETGLFIAMADEVILGADGGVEILKRRT